MNTRFAASIGLLALTGACSFVARSPNQYRDDTEKLLSTRGSELSACFDNALKTTPGISGKVLVHFSVEQKTGKLTNISADASQSTAPQALVDCVTTALNGLVLNPGDQRKGEATYEFEFVGPKVPTPPPPT
jgi:hypothetical protein